ncbi:MAG TPA: hypothetical protein PLP19_00495 [bacterium]|nr:hypothetical protein [bacterium]HPN41942.1 hypothetical protein [bacterium]
MKFNKNIRIIILTVCMIFSLLPNAFGDSYYSAMGLGLPNYFVSPKAVGMGGAGLGVIERFAVNSMNIAAIDVNGLTTVSVNACYDMTGSKENENSVTTRNGNPSGFYFVVPVQKRVLLLVSVKSLTTSKYTLSSNNSTYYVNYTRLVRGNGGLSAGTLGLQYKINDRIRVGATANFNFGTFNEEWKTEFDDGSYVEAADEIVSHLWGVSYDCGAWIKATPQLTLGMVFKSKSRLNLDNKTTLGSSKQYDQFTTKLDYPLSYGLGAAGKFSKVLVALDYYNQLWQDYHEIRDYEFKNYWRVSTGLEYQDTDAPLANYHRRISYRFGYYYAVLPYHDFSGHTVAEQFVSAGLGFPFHRNYGRVDLTIEAGKRAGADTKNYNETVFRFTGSITGSELWFQRHH